MFTRQSARNINADTSLTLDHIRWIAASLVAWSHARYLLIDPSTQIEQSWLAAISLTAQQGHRAVIIFFVLSGFLVGGRLLQDRRSLNWQYLKRYSVDRITRLGAVAWPAILLTVLGGIALLTFTQSGWPTPQDNSCDSISACYSPLGVFGNLTFTSKPLHGNGAFWSIVNEAAYYALSIFILLIVFSKGWALRLASILAVTVIVYFGAQEELSDTHVLMYFPLWVIGSAAACVRPRKIFAPIVLLATLIVALFCTTLSGLAGNIISDYTLGLFIIALIWTVQSWGLAKVLAPSGINKIGTFLSDRSYSLYLTHLIAMRTLILIGESAGLSWFSYRSAFGGSELLAMAVLLTFSILVAHVFYLVFERHHRKLRYQGYELVGVRKATA